MTDPAPRPLAGRRVVVTRARAQMDPLADGLEALGAEVVRFPTIRIDPPADAEPLRRAAARAGRFDWIVFTSANAVKPFMETLAGTGDGRRSLSPVRICAIGDSTSAELARYRIRPDLMPPEFVTESLARALMRAGGLRGSRILLPRSSIARPELPDALRARGAEVVEVEAYRTVPDGEGADRVRALLREGKVDVVTFTSASTARSFVRLVGSTGGAKVATIGPVTSQVARELGLPVDAEAEVHTVPGLVAAVGAMYTREA